LTSSKLWQLGIFQCVGLPRRYASL
jgi:hypothetical protein